MLPQPHQAHGSSLQGDVPLHNRVVSTESVNAGKTDMTQLTTQHQQQHQQQHHTRQHPGRQHHHKAPSGHKKHIMLSFADYAVGRLLSSAAVPTYRRGRRNSIVSTSMNPTTLSTVADLIEESAALYLVGDTKRLHKLAYDLYPHCRQQLLRGISGKASFAASVNVLSKSLMEALEVLSEEYFNEHWDNVPEMALINAQLLDRFGLKHGVEYDHELEKDDDQLLRDAGDDSKEAADDDVDAHGADNSKSKDKDATANTTNTTNNDEDDNTTNNKNNNNNNKDKSAASFSSLSRDTDAAQSPTTPPTPATPSDATSVPLSSSARGWRDCAEDDVAGMSVVKRNTDLADILKRDGRALVCFYASLCPRSKALRPVLRRSARIIRKRFTGDELALVQVEGPKFPLLLSEHHITIYPTLILFSKGHEISRLPRALHRSVSSIVRFVGSGGKLDMRSLARARWKRAIEMVREKVRFHSAARRLHAQREFVTMLEKFKALGCADEAVPSMTTRSFHKPGDDPPHCILLGGGMGAGKSTIVTELSKSDFWQRHGARTVVVAADALKLKDPVYRAMHKSKVVSSMVHGHSTKAAEELFLSALQARRDVVFDGTMSWRPFVEQTLAMVRDNQHMYKRGPGYVTDKDGQLEKEEYWEVIPLVCPRLITPYRVQMIAVTVQPEIAVRRGLMRQLVTGRGVPVRAQLKSHKIFSKNFPHYARLMDTVTLYDNSGSKPIIIAHKPVGCPHLCVHPLKYAQFLAKAKLNVSASCERELYTQEQRDEINTLAANIALTLGFEVPKQMKKDRRHEFLYTTPEDEEKERQARAAQDSTNDTNTNHKDRQRAQSSQHFRASRFRLDAFRGLFSAEASHVSVNPTTGAAYTVTTTASHLPRAQQKRGTVGAQVGNATACVVNQLTTTLNRPRVKHDRRGTSYIGSDNNTRSVGSGAVSSLPKHGSTPRLPSLSVGNSTGSGDYADFSQPPTTEDNKSNDKECVEEEEESEEEESEDEDDEIAHTPMSSRGTTPSGSRLTRAQSLGSIDTGVGALRRAESLNMM